MLYIRYRNSALATFVSFLGEVVIIIGGCALFLGGEILGGILLALLGAAGMLWAKRISNDKEFQQWWKQVHDANLEPVIAENAEVAMEVYRKNPEKRTLEKIRTLNPKAAALIEGSNR